MRALRAKSLFCTIALVLGPSSSAVAQRLPRGAGLPIETDRPPIPDFEDEAAPRPSLALPPLPPARGPATLEAGPGFVVRGFRIVGSTVFSDEELAATIAPFLDRVLHAEGLPAVTDALTRLYIDAGFVSSGAIVPDQTIEDGIVEIHIVEGRVGGLEIAEGGRLSRRYIEPRLRRGLRAPLDIDALEASLRLLQTDPRIDRVDAVLIPDAALGESIVRLEIEEANPWDMQLRAANDLAPTLGGARAMADVVNRNVFGLGDTFRGSVSGARGLLDLDLSYGVPMTPWLTALELRGGVTRGEVVDGDFEDQNFRNELDRYGLALVQPLWRSLENDVRFTLEFERSRSRLTAEDDFPILFETGLELGNASRVNLSMLRLYLDWIHRRPSQVFAMQLRGTFGLDVWDATTPNDTPPAAEPFPTLPDAEFQSWLLQLQYARRIPTWLGDGELITRLDLQVASGSLFSIESFAIGGASTVRGYRENAVVSDNGTIGSIEFRLPILPAELRPHELRLAPFVDAGFAWDDRDPDEKSFDEWLVGIGFGALYRYGSRFEMKAYWGRALRNPSLGEEGPLQGHGFHLEATVFVD